MTFKAVVMDDIIKTESVDREETGPQTKAQALEHLHVRERTIHHWGMNRSAQGSRKPRNSLSSWS